MSAGALDLRQHHDVEFLADRADDLGDVVERPGRVQRVDAGPEAGRAELRALPHLDEARRAPPPWRRREWRLRDCRAARRLAPPCQPPSSALSPDASARNGSSARPARAGHARAQVRRSPAARRICVASSSCHSGMLRCNKRGNKAGSAIGAGASLRGAQRPIVSPPSPLACRLLPTCALFCRRGQLATSDGRGCRDEVRGSWDVRHPHPSMLRNDTFSHQGRRGARHPWCSFRSYQRAIASADAKMKGHGRRAADPNFFVPVARRRCAAFLSLASRIFTGEPNPDRGPPGPQRGPTLPRSSPW